MVEGLIWPGLFPYAGISMAQDEGLHSPFEKLLKSLVNNGRAGSIFIPRLSCWNML